MGTALLVALASAAAAVLAGAPAQAQDAFPTRTIALVNPYPAGGPADLLARTVAKELGTELGQQVVVENRVGGATAIGAQYVARAKPDGYTLFIGGAPSHAITPALLEKPPYDGLKDFAPIAMIASVPSAVFVHPSLKVSSIKELVALAKKDPGKISYASVGVASTPHLAGEQFQQMAGVKLNHVPYTGAAPAMVALLGHQVDMTFLNLSQGLQQTARGEVKLLAMTSAKRSPQAPDTPTLDELGFKGFDISTWYGISAPAATPKPVLDKLAAATAKVLAKKELQEALTLQGAQMMPMGPEEYARYMAEDAKRMVALIKAADIRLK